MSPASAPLLGPVAGLAAAPRLKMPVDHEPSVMREVTAGSVELIAVALVRFFNHVVKVNVPSALTVYVVFACARC